MANALQQQGNYPTGNRDGLVTRRGMPEWARNALMYASIAIVFIIAIMPFYIMIINATRPNAAIDRGLSLLPGRALYYNFVSLTDRVPIFLGLFNSLRVTTSAVVLTSYFPALTAFGGLKE